MAQLPPFYKKLITESWPNDQQIKPFFGSVTNEMGGPLSSEMSGPVTCVIDKIEGSILTGEAKQSFSYIFLEKELRNKFYYDTSSKENKAIKQLLERIEIMLKGGAKYDPNLNERIFRVYPILLTTEFGMTTPGINYLLNKWFLDDLQNNPLLTMHHHRINDLVIIDIDTFIRISSQRIRPYLKVH